MIPTSAVNPDVTLIELSSPMILAAAQAEREKALHQAEEALKQAAVAQRKRARNRNIALVILVFAMLGQGLYFTAMVEREEQKVETVKEQETTRAKLSQLIRAQQDVEEKLRNAAAKIRVGNNPGIEADATSLIEKSRFNLVEAAANVGVATSMTELGQLYENGHGAGLRQSA